MAIAVIIILLLAGAGLIVAAVFLLAGLAWALAAGGAALVAFALALRKGMANG